MGWLPVLYTAGVFLLALSLGMTIALRVGGKKGNMTSTWDVLRLLRSGPPPTRSQADGPSKEERRPSDVPPSDTNERP